MAVATLTDAEPVIRQQRTILDELVKGYKGPDFNVRFWDGSNWGCEPDQAKFTLALKHEGALRLMFWPFNNTGLGEAYIFDDFDIEGDIHSFFVLIRHLVTRKWSTFGKVQMLRRLTKLPKKQNERHGGPKAAQVEGAKRSLGRDAAAIGYAYDTSNDFYKLFLDKNMLYSCAYFKSPDEHIDTSEERKLDLVCRKLRLQPGEKFLDIGCGWGGLLVHAAKNYGVSVTGITLSREQQKLVEQRIKDENLGDRCRVLYQDYRDIPPTGEYDKAASVGLAEHIGEKMMPVLMQRAWDAIKPRGQYLHHGITLRANTPYPSWSAFARKFVFPDGEVRPILTALKAGESVGFEIRDVESLREHYILTLENWVKRLEERHDEAVKITDEVTYRIFRIYLGGAARGYRTGLYNLYQTLFVKPDADGVTGLPLLRENWYPTN